jgi:hypothetical protein
MSATLGVQLDNEPPLFKRHCSISIFIYAGKEVVQLPIGYNQTCTPEGSLQFSLVQCPIMVAINAIEEEAQLVFGVRNKHPKFLFSVSKTTTR